MPTKILIIKLGYSETLDSEIGKVPSLGDVLRTTPILWALKERFPDSHITWLISEHSEPLLKGNRFIDRLLVWDQFVPFQLMREKIDVLINLEKVPGVAALSDMIDAWTKYGFRFDSNKGTYHSYERGLDFIDYIEKKKDGQKCGVHWQRVLIEMLGVEWKCQEYVLGYKPSSEESLDIGLNYMAGSKWPTKMMPMYKWNRLENELTALGYKVSFQKGLKDLYEYMEWINSCRVIITQDSLGLHLALAMNKGLIGLYGPTDPGETYLYKRGKHVLADVSCPNMPCYCPTCPTDLQCMESINVEEIIGAVKNLLGLINVA